MAKHLVLMTLDYNIPSSNPTRGVIDLMTVLCFMAWSHSLSPLHCLDMAYLFALRFYSLVNPLGSCRARSVYLTTLVLGRLSPLSS